MITRNGLLINQPCQNTLKTFAASMRKLRDKSEYRKKKRNSFARTHLGKATLIKIKLYE